MCSVWLQLTIIFIIILQVIYIINLLVVLYSIKFKTVVKMLITIPQSPKGYLQIDSFVQPTVI